MMAIMVVAFTLAGYSFFLLLRREGAALGLALVGGVMLQLMPTFFIATAYTNMNLLGWFWLPTLILLWGRIARNVRDSSPFLRWRGKGAGGIGIIALALRAVRHGDD